MSGSVLIEFLLFVRLLAVLLRFVVLFLMVARLLRFAVADSLRSFVSWLWYFCLAASNCKFNFVR